MADTKTNKWANGAIAAALKRVPIDTKHINNQNDRHITLGTHKVNGWTKLSQINTILQAMNKHVQGCPAVYPQCVTFKDHEDREHCRELLKGKPVDIEGRSTIPELLDFAKKTASDDSLPTLFVFHEPAGYTGKKERDDPPHPQVPISHLWGGMLIKRADTTGEEWALALYDVSWRPGLQIVSKPFIEDFGGRRKLWHGLREAGMKVTSLNFCSAAIVKEDNQCVINTMFWLYQASVKPDNGRWAAGDVNVVAKADGRKEWPKATPWLQIDLPGTVE